MIPLPRHVVNFDWELENETGEHTHEDSRGAHSHKPVSSQTNTSPTIDNSCWDEVGCFVVLINLLEIICYDEAKILNIEFCLGPQWQFFHCTYF